MSDLSFGISFACSPICRPSRELQYCSREGPSSAPLSLRGLGGGAVHKVQDATVQRVCSILMYKLFRMAILVLS